MSELCTLMPPFLCVGKPGGCGRHSQVGVAGLWVWRDLRAGGPHPLDRDGAVAVGSDGFPSSRDHPRPGYVWDSSLISLIPVSIPLIKAVSIAQILAFYLMHCHVSSHQIPHLFAMMTF
jgi:hypothetical protein